MNIYFNNKNEKYCLPPSIIMINCSNLIKPMIKTKKPNFNCNCTKQCKIIYYRYKRNQALTAAVKNANLTRSDIKKRLQPDCNVSRLIVYVV